MLGWGWWPPTLAAKTEKRRGWGTRGSAVGWAGLALPEVGGLDAEGAEVDEALAAVVDFVVDGVLDHCDARHLPLAEGLVDLGEAMGRDGGELGFEFNCLRVPEREDLGFGGQVGGGIGAGAEFGPLAGGDAIDDWTAMRINSVANSEKGLIPPREKLKSLSSGKASMVRRVRARWPCQFLSRSSAERTFTVVVAVDIKKPPCVALLAGS